MFPFISIIIPCKSIDKYALESIHYCKQLVYDKYEIILLPDTSEMVIDGVTILVTGPASPGKKRNIGVIESRGELCAFLDSDAYPDEAWLNNSLKYFSDPEVFGVSGPGVTPPNDTFLQKASGHVFAFIGMDKLTNRYAKKETVESNDMHSCNFLIRKNDLLDIGGWNEHYWPGEDTILSGEIFRRGKKIVIASDVFVYHHRRPLFSKHLLQVWRFGFHRGLFTKHVPENSRKSIYFFPSCLVLMMLFGGIGLIYFTSLQYLFI